MSLMTQTRSYEAFFSEKLATKKEGTRKGYTYALKDFEVFTEVKYKKNLEQMIKEFKKAEIETIIDVLQSWVNQSKIEKRNKQLRLSLLNNYFYYRGIKIDSRDMKDIEFDEGEPEERKAISKEDLQKIVASAKKPGMRALVLSLATSGMAIGEACHIKKKDIDTTQAKIQIHIQRSYTKRNGRGRTVYISKEAEKELRPILEKKESNDLVFTNGDNPIVSKDNEMARFRRIVDSLKLGNRYESKHREITLHALRAYFYTKAVQVHGEAYAHKMTGHKGYLEEYNRYGDKKKLEMYLQLEPELFVFEAKPEPQEIKELKISFEKLKRENTRQFEELERENTRQFESLKFSYNILNKLILDGPDESDRVDGDDFYKMYNEVKSHVKPDTSQVEKEHFKNYEKMKAQEKHDELKAKENLNK